jgi:hypothetical protein
MSRPAPRHRLISAILGALISLMTLEAIERYRSTQTPPGWTRVHGTALPVTEPVWRIGNSSWRMGANTTWTSTEANQQLYLRPVLSEGSQIGSTLSNHQGEPLWIWLAADGQVAAMQDGVVIPCMGRILQDATVQAIELSLDDDGLKVKKGSAQMICPADSTAAQTPQIQTLDGEVELHSVGRDRRRDGIPLSPLWWMSGLMALCFTWMLLFDLLLGLLKRIRSFTTGA